MRSWRAPLTSFGALTIVASADLGELGPREGAPVAVDFNPLWNFIRLAPWLVVVYLLFLGQGPKRWGILLPLAAIQIGLAVFELAAAGFDLGLLPYLDAASLLSATLAALCAFRFLAPHSGRGSSELQPVGVLPMVGGAGALCCTGLSFALLLYGVGCVALMAASQRAAALPVYDFTLRRFFRAMFLPLAVYGTFAALLLEFLTKFPTIQTLDVSSLPPFLARGLLAGTGLWGLAVVYGWVAHGTRALSTRDFRR